MASRGPPPRDRLLQIPGAVAPDGTLAFTRFDAEGSGDIWVLPGDGDARPLFDGPESERSPSFSPRGDHLAFVSDRSGRDEVYAAPYPGGAPPLLVSAGGGREPVWAPDGRTLFYRSGDRMMAVALSTRGSPAAGRPRLVFELPSAPITFGQSNYDVAADGGFLLVKPIPATTATRLSVVLNWFSEMDGLIR